MSRVVNEIPCGKKRTKPGVPVKRATHREYPWRLWLDGQTHELTRGEDYDEPQSVRVSAYSQARRLGIEVVVVASDRGDRILVRATPPADWGQAVSETLTRAAPALLAACKAAEEAYGAGNWCGHDIGDQLQAAIKLAGGE